MRTRRYFPLDMMKKYKNILILALLFLLFRSAILFFFADTVFPTLSESREAFYTKEIVSGLRLPFTDYVIQENSLGRLLFAFLRIPVYLMGRSVLFEGLAAILASLLILMLWYRFLREHFSENVAVIFGLLFIFAPTHFLSVNFVFAWKARFLLNTLGTIAALGLFYKIFYQKKASVAICIALGLMCGLLSWIDHIFFMTTISLLILWFLKDKLFFLKKEFLVFLLFFLIGMLPWFGFIFSGGLPELQGKMNVGQFGSGKGGFPRGCKRRRSRPAA